MGVKIVHPLIDLVARESYISEINSIYRYDSFNYPPLRLNLGRVCREIVKPLLTFIRKPDRNGEAFIRRMSALSQISYSLPIFKICHWYAYDMQH